MAMPDPSPTTDPDALFEEWLAEARIAEPNDPTAMALATADAAGRPSLRMVLLKGHDARGFVFYTNLDSRKGAELAANPRAALLFHWKSLRRQVRVEGPVAPVSAEESDAYFATRGRDSQLGAWASDQSRPLSDRATFEARFAAATAKFEGQDVPRPPRWSGFRIVPERVEFWNDRAHRLHERRLFVRTAGGWSEGLLYP
jgi:pyridoxamine 5'-phosphate oxidase